MPRQIEPSRHKAAPVAENVSFLIQTKASNRLPANDANWREFNR
jgi:hypothetical protein